MVIYSPSYQGKHNYNRYKKMKNDLLQIKEDCIIDVDFLYDNEIETYTLDVLADTILTQTVIKNLRYDYNIWIQSKDKKRLRKIRKYLKKRVIEVENIFMVEGRYRIKIIQ